MRNKGFLKIAGLICLLLPCMFFMVACDEDNNPPHTQHNFEETWIKTATHHYLKCDGCEEIDKNDEHSFEDYEFNDETDPNNHTVSCSVCGYARVEAHGFGAIEQDNAQNHKQTCVCGKVRTVAHNFTATVSSTDPTKHVNVCACGYTETVGHNFGATFLEHDEDEHKRQCVDCGHFEFMGHTLSYRYDGATPDLHTKECDVCGYSEAVAHNYGGYVYSPSSPSVHTRTCSDCSHVEETEHSFGSYTRVSDIDHTRTCSVCHMIETHEHVRVNPFADCTACGDTVGMIDITTDAYIDTCEIGAQTGSIVGVEANAFKVFKYTTNSVPISTININVTSGTYTVKVYRYLDGRFVEVPFVNNASNYSYNLVNLNNVDLYILISMGRVGSNISLTVTQTDTVVVTRNLNGGTLANNTTVNVVYGTDYSTSAINFGVPTKNDYDFIGWFIVNSSDNTETIITGEDGLYDGAWVNVSSIDFRNNGAVTIKAGYSLITRTVYLNTNGGVWSDSTSSNRSVTLSHGGSIIPSNIPEKTGYVFAGYFADITGGTCHVSKNGSVKNVSSLTNDCIIYACWATVVTEAGIDVTYDGLFVVETGDWTVPTGSTSYAYINLPGRALESYQLFVYDEQYNLISYSFNRDRFPLAPNSTYFLYINTMSAAMDDQPVVITRSGSTYPTDAYMLTGNNVVANEKNYLRVRNNTESANYRLEIKDGSTSNPMTNVASVKLYDSSLTLIDTITPNGSNGYDLALGNSTYYVEVIFNSDASNVKYVVTKP